MERWIGELTASERDHWVIATKAGLPTVSLPGPLGAFNQPAKKLKQRLRGPDFALDAGSVRRRIEGSLRRLRRERIEFFFLHWPPDDIADDAEMLGALREAQQAGLIAEFGVSSDAPMTLHRVREAWGSTCAETAVNPLSPSGSSPGALAGLDVIANQVMGPAGTGAILPDGTRETAAGSPTFHRRLLRHAAATAGVKVVLTGTASPRHLRENAAALVAPVTSADLIV